jgi:hypothetical protein
MSIGSCPENRAATPALALVRQGEGGLTSGTTVDDQVVLPLIAFVIGTERMLLQHFLRARAKASRLQERIEQLENDHRRRRWRR